MFLREIFLNKIEYHTNTSDALTLMKSIYKPRGDDFLNNVL